MSSAIRTSPRSRLVNRLALAVALLGALAGPAAAASGTVNYAFGGEGGAAWFFLNDAKIEKIQMDPQWEAGGYFTVISDFAWARNFAFELHYFRSQGHGQFQKNSTTQTFDVEVDRPSFNFTYFFGGTIYEPFLSGGFGVGHFVYRNRTGTFIRRTTEEWDAAINVGGGLDFRIGRVFTVGARILYVYFAGARFVSGYVSAISPTLRIGARF